MTNYSYGVEYTLYTIENGKETLEEQTTAGEPFRFMSGFGMALDAFEEQITALDVDGVFDFILEPEKAYGEHIAEHVLTLDKEMFKINGMFDTKNIFVGAIVPLQNADGQRFFGQVKEITDDKVVMDLNHPLAGKTLHFVGKVTEKRECTPKEIEAMVNHMSGGGCGGCGGCGSCGGNCGDGGCSGGGCGNCGK